MLESRSTDTKALVLQAIDIVELIGQSVALKRAGSRFKGLCPFHQEKTPSFTVNPQRQSFICFGCKASGNAIDFVMKRDRVQFIDALRLLADQYGIPMPRFRGGSPGDNAGERQALLEANSAACQFFENQLATSPLGAAAKKYLAERGFDAESIKRFRIGVAPDAWDGLSRSPLMRKFPPGVLLQGGLLKARESGGHYDTFRNRLMFPIRDENGRIIAFGGRATPGSNDPAKYLNSPETPLFSKSRCIFGLDLARQRIVETRTVAVVEGYTDVVMAHQFGVSNVVSVLGTALTEQHVQVLRRFADRIVLLFDADAAGDTAVNRSVELFLTQPIDIAIASLPHDVDPDEFLLQNGVEAFEKLLSQANGVLPFMRRQFKKQWEAAAGDILKQDAARRQFMAPFIAARSGGRIETERWGAVINTLSKETGIPESILHREYGSAAKVQRRSVGPGSKDARVVSRSEPVTRQSIAERHLLGALLADPQRWDVIQKEVSTREFTDETRQRLAETLWEHQRHEGATVFNEFLAALGGDDELVQLAVELVERVDDLPDLEVTIAAALSHFRESRQQQLQAKLLAEARRTSEEGRTIEDADDVLRQLAKQAAQPDLRRIGS